MSDFAFLIPSGLTPALAVATMDRHLGWALTLAALTLFLFQRAPKLVRFALGAAVFVLTVVPAPWSVAHGLGQAYQIPGLVTQVLAALYVFRTLSQQGVRLQAQGGETGRWPLSTLLVGSVMGWMLVLDTFAVLPVSLYALGYSQAGAIFGLVLAAAFWIVSMKSGPHEGRRARDLAIALLAAIALYTFTRLPSGNAWDAMLDPWLWIAAQAALFTRMVQSVLSRYRIGSGKGRAEVTEETGKAGPRNRPSPERALG